MKEVAERAGVSVATVSHVINKTRYVSPELTKRVEDVIRELDYHPNPLGRSLRKGESNTIALLVSDIANPFFPDVARGVEDCARANGYNLVLCNTDETPSMEKHYLSLLKGRKIDGFIIAPTADGIKNLKGLIDERIPIVLIDRKVEGVEVDQVYSDNVGGAYQAVRHLIKMGHRNIGIILEITEIGSFADRLSGYKKALRDNGIEVREDYIKQAGLEIDGAYAATKSLLEEHPEISAIFSTNNVVTRGVLKYFKEAGIKCPEEVSLVGFDDPDWAASFTPSITSVAQQPYEMGYTATTLLLEKIGANRSASAAEIRKITLPVNLIVRESTKAFKEKTV
jgi:LacI family transcriptional regulator